MNHKLTAVLVSLFILLGAHSSKPSILWADTHTMLDLIDHIRDFVSKYTVYPPYGVCQVT